jgi:hypothetical protein
LDIVRGEMVEEALYEPSVSAYIAARRRRDRQRGIGSSATRGGPL